MTTSTDTGFVHQANPDQMEIPLDKLRVQVEIYKENIIMRRFDGQTVQVTMISADDLANTFAQSVGYQSGILPPNTLWWKQRPSGQLVALWRPPGIWPAALQSEPLRPPERFNLPMPGLVFICSPGQAPWVLAARERPQSPQDTLYRMPAFNIFRDGRVCPGNHRFPQEVDQTPESFFKSFFSLTGDTHNRSHKHPKDLRALWEEIDDTQTYPLDDLVQQTTVAKAMEIHDGHYTNAWN